VHHEKFDKMVNRNLSGFHNSLNAGDGGDRRDRTDDLKLAKLPLYQLSYVPSSQSSQAKRVSPTSHTKNMVGLGRLELPTSRLSSARSNQLSYRPEKGNSLCCVTKKEKRRRRHPAKWAPTLEPYVSIDDPIEPKL
jgi:hypothetical protein